MNELTLINKETAEQIMSALNDYLEPKNIKVEDITDEVYLDNTICIYISNYDVLSLCKYAEERMQLDLKEALGDCVASALDSDYKVVKILEKILPENIGFCWYVG